MKKVIIIQARMSSSRLPGKVLKEIGDRPMLGWVVERARQAKSADSVMVATTNDASDDTLETYCRAHKVPVFRGSSFDVLDRYYRALEASQADVVIRLTADCPLIDPGLIDQLVDGFLERGVDFAANRLPPPWKRTYPIGLDIEVASADALRRAWTEAEEKFEREHVMPYLYDKQGRFKIWIMDHSEDHGSLRWTVDTPEDLEAVRLIFSRLEHPLTASWLDVLELVKSDPALMALNAAVPHKTLTEIDSRMASKG